MPDTTTAEALRIHLCPTTGSVLDGFTAADPSADWTPEPGSVAEVYVPWYVQTLDKAERGKFMAKLYAAMSPGARIRISVPDFAAIAKCFAEGRDTVESASGPYRLDFEALMLGTKRDGSTHRSLYTEDELWTVLFDAGFVCVAPWKSDFHDESALPISANLEAYKPPETMTNGVVTRNVHAVMSTPRLGFMITQRCMFKTLPRRGIAYSSFEGVFFGQQMTRAMLRSIETGAEWIITLDMDSVFTDAELDKLLLMMEAHPEIDALTGLQPQRDGLHVLFKDPDVLKKRWSEEVVPVDAAHFGLTILRVDALKRMPHPWFLGVPNDEGKWDEGRTDEDMYFWKKWKEIGNTLAVCPRVPIGHSELMVMWWKRAGGVMIQHWRDFESKGVPLEAKW